MARTAILSNGELTVGLDEVGLVNDFYFPYVGLDNLTTARSMHHKIGVWVDGEFSWTDDSSVWSVTSTLRSDGMITNVMMNCDKHGVSLHTEDFVDHKYNFFGRKIKVVNNTDSVKNVRIFMHQVFQISRAGRSDTALYVPRKHYIYNYKGRTCLLIAGQADGGENFDQFAVGSYGIEGKKGTYMDAEDGELSGSTVEHAGVDSVIRFSFEIDAISSKSINYWVVADDSRVACEQTHSMLLDKFDERLGVNKEYWEGWLNISQDFTNKLSENTQDFVKRSLLTIKAHCDEGGGIIASCDSSIYNYGRDYYNYVWPRDGALAIWPLIKLGYKDEPKKFIKFCADLATDAGYMMHKYQPDKAVGSTWHSLVQNGKPELAIQEDETALIVIMLSEYFTKFGDEDFVRDIFDKFVIKAANFMCSYVDNTGLPHPSYDLWEQKYITSTFTTATVYRALRSASVLAKKFGSEPMTAKWDLVANKIAQNFALFMNPDDNVLRKGFVFNEENDSFKFDNTLDASSFYAVMKFMDSGFASESMNATLKAVNEQLLNQAHAHGVARYPRDGYFKARDDLPANAWHIATLWLAQYYIKSGDQDKADELIKTVEDNVVADGILSEQISSADGQPVSVAPLVWSHAEYINTVIDLTNKSKSNQ